MKRNSYCNNIDIMDTNVFPDYDILYCDPPWEQRMVKFFQTIMEKQVGVIVNNDIDGILNKLGKLSHQNKPIFVEYSIKGTERVINILKSHGHKHKNTITLLQENGKPYNLIIFNIDYKPTGNVKGFMVVRMVVTELKPKIVFDPFAGIGATAKEVLKSGSTYIGHEMNRVRCNRLKKILDENI